MNKDEIRYKCQGVKLQPQFCSNKIEIWGNMDLILAWTLGAAKNKES